MGFLDRGPFDATDPDGRALLEALLAVYDQVPSVREFVLAAGLRTADFPLWAPMSQVWPDVLRKAASQGLLRRLITAVARDPGSVAYDVIARLAAEPVEEGTRHPLGGRNLHLWPGARSVWRTWSRSGASRRPIRRDWSAGSRNWPSWLVSAWIRLGGRTPCGGRARGRASRLCCRRSCCAPRPRSPTRCGSFRSSLPGVGRPEHTGGIHPGAVGAADRAARQPAPPALPESTQEVFLLGLLRQTAGMCAEGGRRLVLVVDGLDEDRGVTTGPNAHSIAGFLPADPPHGMRVIVPAAEPADPDDVPGWHPLRDPQVIRDLADSGYARDVERLSRQELRRLLRGPAAARDVLGLVAAANGGLSASDLEELTGSPLWDVEEILHSSGGRTFTRRPHQWGPGAVPETYSLGHEKLQAAAVDASAAGAVWLGTGTDCAHGPPIGRPGAGRQGPRSTCWVAITRA